MKYIVIDRMIPENGGSEGVYEGTLDECQDWVAKQGFGYDIVPIQNVKR